MRIVAVAFVFSLATPPSRGDTAPVYGVSEPANYAYSYIVKDDYFGVDFKAGKNHIKIKNKFTKLRFRSNEFIFSFQIYLEIIVVKNHISQNFFI